MLATEVLESNSLSLMADFGHSSEIRILIELQTLNTKLRRFQLQTSTLVDFGLRVLFSGKTFVYALPIC